ncbi:hypothetical protein HK105_205323 [Polyrhizophydium stewartii]|uniref:Citrate synthase n=1 Tax=Polyrhizophydium stewartii TaxID=2732419 RepID=A0ABR4N6S2_9FUNG|nr:hypothetical protein HK105_003491 [Polyrhizophydium stewartii]
MPDNTLTITDPATGTAVTVPIGPGAAIPATALAQFKITPTCPPAMAPTDRVPVRLFDPGFKNTAVCRSAISSADGDNGRLLYRGYDVAELVERADFLEVAFLLIRGRLPSKAEYEQWVFDVMHHTYLHAELEQQMHTFRYDAHPMGMVISTIASLSTFHPEANPALKGDALYMKPKIAPGKEPTDDEAARIASAEAARNRAIARILGKVPTIAANAYRHRQGRPYNSPMHNGRDYCENLLYMMDALNEPSYRPDPRLVKILNKVFILLAENGSNCSSVMIRHLASSGVDPYTALSGAAGALFGERKSAAVIEMLQKIGSVDKIDAFLELVKSGGSAAPGHRKSRVRLMGFGHRIYKTQDPRVRICKGLVLELFELMGKDSIGDLALALEAKALADPYFTERKLNPNIDYWTGLLFYTLRFPSDMFPVWMFIPRAAGMVAHLIESIDDPEFKIFRPRQIYIGENHRKYEDLGPVRRMSLRGEAPQPALDTNYVLSDPLAARRRGATTEAETIEEITTIHSALAEIARAIDNLELRTAEGDAKPGSDKAVDIEGLRAQLAQLNERQARLMSHAAAATSASSGSFPSRGLRQSAAQSPNLLAGSGSPRVIARHI